MKKSTPAGTPVTPIKPIPKPKKRDPKDARNLYRRRAGIPLDAPKYSRTDPFNRPRRGSGNIERVISMPPDWWRALDFNRGDQTRGEHIMQALRCDWIISGYKIPGEEGGRK